MCSQLEPEGSNNKFLLPYKFLALLPLERAGSVLQTRNHRLCTTNLAEAVHNKLYAAFAGDHPDMRTLPEKLHT
ncbi:unnamed protein product [Cylicocyclus nassatus]|uniref:Uncharacterized protein n=1 Tax=Cylicocyclus nassatus TaxID=53992 RepID=A0AA36M396_CYLNA|nr:unnamed protein product [Cylicocyclus nassatus]